MTYSCNGSKIASCSHDGSVRIWDATFGSAVGSPLTLSSPAMCLGYSPNANQIALGCYKTIQVLDAGTGEMIKAPFSSHSVVGFGPISFSIDELLPGRYHVYAHSRPAVAKVGSMDQEIGWPDSMAVLKFCGSDRVQGWNGADYFVSPKEGAGEWWDVCFLDVDAHGNVNVRSFNTYCAEEPGYRSVTVTCLDVLGEPVHGVRVQCIMLSMRNTGDFGDSDEAGQVSLRLPLGTYAVSVSHPDFMQTTVSLCVDIEPVHNAVTVPMVKETYFSSPSDMLCVLTGGGSAAKLVVEAPGRCVWESVREQEEAEGGPALEYDHMLQVEPRLIPAMTMLQAGDDLKACMLTRPSAVMCPWVAGDGEERGESLRSRIYDDRIVVVLDGGQYSEANMQLSLFTQVPNARQSCWMYMFLFIAVYIMLQTHV